MWSGRFPTIVPQQATQSLAAFDLAASPPDFAGRNNDPISQALVITARSFEKTFIPAGSGGQDRATLCDSSDDDRLDAAGTWAKRSYPDRFIHLSDSAAIARVKAISSKGGQDTKHTEATDYVLET